MADGTGDFGAKPKCFWCLLFPTGNRLSRRQCIKQRVATFPSANKGTPLRTPGYPGFIAVCSMRTYLLTRGYVCGTSSLRKNQPLRDPIEREEACHAHRQRPPPTARGSGEPERPLSVLLPAALGFPMSQERRCGSDRLPCCLRRRTGNLHPGRSLHLPQSVAPL